MADGENLEIATFAGGCFWCTEAVFQQLNGVHSVVSGYEGGHVDNPTYEQVCTGQTGHAEVIRMEFDPETIPFEDLLRVFFLTHDPTTLNRQGADVGTQYRSAVFYQNSQQKATAERVIEELNSAGEFDGPIVTTLEPSATFYPAEEYHQDYFRRNPSQGYCNAVIPPKLRKLRAKYSDKLKSVVS